MINQALTIPLLRRFGNSPIKKHEITLEAGKNGKINAHCLELPGCHSWGDTREEALRNIKEAIEGYMMVLN